MWLFFARDLKKTLDMKIWTKSSPTHETGLQIAHFCDLCGSFLLQISRNSRHEILDEIIAHSWNWSPDRSLLWLMWLFWMLEIWRNLSTWQIWMKSSPTHENGLEIAQFCEWKWLFCITGLKKLSTSVKMWTKSSPRKWLSVNDVAILNYRSQEILDMTNWTKSSPTHENGLQLAHFCEWSGSLVL